MTTRLYRLTRELFEDACGLSPDLYQRIKDEFWHHHTNAVNQDFINIMLKADELKELGLSVPMTLSGHQ